jgi:outer membrane immunogenic protein
MRRFALGLLTSTALIGLGGYASAADMAPTYKAPPAAPVVAPFSWTGFYIGAHIGGGWSDTDWPGAVIGSPGVSYDMDGFLGGAQVGFNYQVGSWVFGIEGDVSWTDIDGSGTDIFGIDYSSNIDWLGSITGRLGVAWDRWLLYVKGGVAFGEGSGSVFDPLTAVGFTTDDETQVGWTLGAGVEWAFWDAWSAKLEYQYYAFDDIDLTFVDPITATAIGVNTDVDVHTVKFGINYRFGTGIY